MDEFSLIHRLFSRHQHRVSLGVGDDCALIQSPEGRVAVSTDTLVEGVHFFENCDPYALGHKALAVNLSDLAAMGAKPLGFTLALSLPNRYDMDYLSRFSQGLYDLAEQFNCPLIGGDTTSHPSHLTITITILGAVPGDQALLRSGACAGDQIWVSGYLGAAAYAVDVLYGRVPRPQYFSELQNALDFPQPRVELGLDLLSLANSALDISDGLTQDLSHILTASQCGAELYTDLLPIAPYLDELTNEQRLHYALNGGDVYELCFTADAKAESIIRDLAHQHSLPLTPIGVILPESGLYIKNHSDEKASSLVAPQGYKHF